MVRERDLERLLRNEPDPQRAAELLIDAANRAGGEDNTSVVVVDVLEVDPVEIPDPDALVEAAAPAPVHRPPMRPAPEPEPAAPARVPTASLGSRIRGTLLLFVPLILVLAIAVGGVGYYARRSYYVGFATNRVVIYKGVPGGVLGWNPTIEQPTGLTAGQLTQVDHDRVAAGSGRGSLEKARQFVQNLRAHVNATSTTTTTKPRRAPTTTRPRTSTSRPRSATATAP
jgi:protein phosphatase